VKPLPWLLLLAASLAACGEEREEPARTAEPEAAAATEEPASPADALATQVWAAAGGEALDQVAHLDFRFVVEDAGEVVFEAMHHWDRAGKRDRVSWVDGEGVLHDAIVDLDERTACGTLDGVVAAGEAAAALAEDAYGRWVNDSYWLMVPLKVLDPGVSRREIPAEGALRRLELTFAGVGLTPGDRYVLDVDPEGRITRWEMSLQGSEPPPKGVSFSGHTEVGPLTLPLEHAVEGAERRVLLRDVEVLGEPAPDAFRLRGCAPPE
tara:strand:+ start:5159 stop:5956 length:798 start_codon:yes stop_codon:yes gene_type:complete